MLHADRGKQLINLSNLDNAYKGVEMRFVENMKEIYEV